MNAFQSQADVVMQKSLREGFGLTVTEAMWKVRPTVAGNVGGIPLQIEDGETGFLVSSPEEAAERAAASARATRSSPSAWAGPARSAPGSIFLTPRLLRDWLRACSGSSSWSRRETARAASSSDRHGRDRAGW